MELALGLISIILLLGSSYYLGDLSVRLFRLTNSINFIFKLAIGFGLSSYTLLFFACLDLLYITVVLPVFVLLSIIGYRKSYTLLLNYLNTSLRKKNIPNNDYALLAPWCLIFLVLAFAFLEVLAPSTTTDSLNYHFRIPYDYVQNNGLVYSPYQPYNMPHLVQVLTTMPFMLGASDVGAHLLYFLFVLAFMFSFYQFAQEYFGSRVALYSLLLISTTPMFTYIKVSGRVEIALTFYIVLGVYALVRGIQNFEGNRSGWLFVSGIMAGLSCGVKYYGLFFLVACLLTLISFFLRRKSIKEGVICITIFTLASVLFGFPFYLKNLLMVGNPIFPALFSIFGGLDWSPSLVMASEQYFDQYKRPGGSSFFDFIISPWNLTVDGEKFNAGRTGYGFLYMCVAPIVGAVVFKQLRCSGEATTQATLNILKILVLIIVVLWSFWFVFAFQRGRHLFPVFTFMSLITVFSLEWFISNNSAVKGMRYWRYILRVLLIGAISFQIVVSSYFTLQFVPVVFGVQTNKQFLSKVRPIWNDYNYVNKELSRNAKVLHLFGDWQYYLKHKQFYPSPYFQGWIDWTKQYTVEEYMKIIQQSGFTHIIGNTVEYYYERAKDWDNEETKNIYAFHQLNAKLIERYGVVIYSRVSAVPKSRTSDLGVTPTTFSLYEINFPKAEQFN